MAKLLGYHFEVVYKPGPENKAADSLSRMFDEGELKSITSFPIWLQMQQVQQEVEHDEKLKKVIEDIQVDSDAHPGFSLQQGTLLYKNRLVLSSKSACIPMILQELHSTPVGGHSGFLRTYRRVAGNLYWIGMKKFVQEFVRNCYVCQRQIFRFFTSGLAAASSHSSTDLGRHFP